VQVILLKQGLSSSKTRNPEVIGLWTDLALGEISVDARHHLWGEEPPFGLNVKRGWGECGGYVWCIESPNCACTEPLHMLQHDNDGVLATMNLQNTAISLAKHA